MKERIVAVGAAIILLISLVGCTSSSVIYDDDVLITSGVLSSDAEGWESSVISDLNSFTYHASADSYTGSTQIAGLRVIADTATFDLYHTITVEDGKAKYVIVNDETKTIEKSYDTSGCDTIALEKGTYTLYIIGQDSKEMDVDISIYNYDAVAWKYET